MLHKEGFPWVFYPLLFAGTSLLFKKRKAALLGLGIGLANAFFFRNPKREPVLDPELIISPADGKVVTCQIEENPSWFSAPLWRIGIFMRLWDVHINRSPITGKVLRMQYVKGEKLPVFKKEAFQQNEKQLYLIEREDGTPFWVVQIAGMVARRIRAFVLPGDDVVAGDPIGIIKFSSRVELFFPVENAEIYVKEGHRVFAGETVLGRMLLKKD
ncbi:phosphatidylserine decarboxylase [Thermodesulfobacterium hveragerdense]|uniref:phosphatidylserine decarboxylase n=1 Tax=Thermodesulfobacterium hveragerdense TaxID=53424 RepID=UPI0003FEDE7E|nr:phosphatidylserine decarboxylase [Thermodesulfobacterium hveragerdense]